MTPHQQDYGKSGDETTTLVPGALIAYRHFALNTRAGTLVSLGGHGSGDYEGDGPWMARCRKSGWIKERPEPPTPGCVCPWVPTFGEEHDAWCQTHQRHQLEKYRQSLECWERMQACPTPSVDCSCGFYAHYDPGTDFYPKMFWVPDGRCPWWMSCTNIPIVRTVVELSGKVVMGRLGVRAQKMRVVALTVDWGKFAAESRDAFVGSGSVPQPLSFGRDECPNPEFYEGLAAEAAERLGAVYYADPKAMYEAHPRPDLSALGITPAEPEPEPKPQGLGVYANGLFAGPKPTPIDPALPKAFMRLKSASFTATGTINPKAFTGIGTFHVIYDDTPISVVKPKPKVVDPAWGAALEAKRNRPAPPGTGIDRRRGRLR